jgi:phage gpG-like protein
LKNLKKNNLAIKNKIKTIPNDIAILAKSHFDGNFTRQGFDGIKWKEVQRRISGTKTYKSVKNRDRTRAILSGKTKTLAKSIYIKSASLKRIVIASSSKYGAIHNSGTNKIPQRKFLGNSQVLNKKILNLLNKIMK